MSHELTVWLQGCLDDVEQVARAAKGAWIPLGPHPDDVRPIAELMRLHDPARVLAQVAATRRLVELHDGNGGAIKYCEVCVSDRTDDVEGWLGDLSPCLTLRLLALPFADRPGFKPEWRPDA